MTMRSFLNDTLERTLGARFFAKGRDEDGKWRTLSEHATFAEAQKAGSRVWRACHEDCSPEDPEDEEDEDGHKQSGTWKGTFYERVCVTAEPTSETVSARCQR